MEIIEYFMLGCLKEQNYFHLFKRKSFPFIKMEIILKQMKICIENFIEQ